MFDQEEWTINKEMSFEKIIIWVWFIGLGWREGTCTKMEHVAKKMTLSYEKLQGGLHCQIWPVKKNRKSDAI